MVQPQVLEASMIVFNFASFVIGVVYVVELEDISLFIENKKSKYSKKKEFQKGVLKVLKKNLCQHA